MKYVESYCPKCGFETNENLPKCPVCKEWMTAVYKED